MQLHETDDGVYQTIVLIIKSVPFSLFNRHLCFIHYSYFTPLPSLFEEVVH